MSARSSGALLRSISSPSVVRGQGCLFDVDCGACHSAGPASVCCSCPMRVTGVGQNCTDQSLGLIHLKISLALHGHRRWATSDFLRIGLPDSSLIAIGRASTEG